MLAPAVQNTRQRLARHYVEKLQKTSALYRRGGNLFGPAFKQLQQDWEQIKQWQAWSSADWQDANQAHLCAGFSTQTAAILRLQMPPREHYSWTVRALEAARLVNDRAAELHLLWDAGYLSLTLEDLEQAEQYAQALLQQTEAEEDKRSLAQACYIQGAVLFKRGNITESEQAYQNCLQYYEACGGIDDLQMIYREMGRVAQFSGQLERALMYFQRYHDRSVASQDSHGQMDACISLSGIYLALKDYPASELHAETALALLQAFKTSRIAVSARLSLAHAQKWQGKLESACTHYQIAVETARTIGPLSSLSNGLYGLGQARYMQRDYPAALAHLNAALDVARSGQVLVRVCEASHDLVYAHLALNDLQAAAVCLGEALQITRQLNKPPFQTKSLAAAVSFWRAYSDFEQAAVWAGLLSLCQAHLHPSLFDSAEYAVLEQMLGAARYQAAFERGKSLTLGSIVDDIEAHLRTLPFHQETHHA